MCCIKLFCFEETLLFKGYLNYTVSCDDGDLKLVGGESESEGLLEVCFSQRWGTVNRDGWSSSDTQVACRQLGFETTSKLNMLDQEPLYYPELQKPCMLLYTVQISNILLQKGTLETIIYVLCEPM